MTLFVKPSPPATQCKECKNAVRKFDLDHCRRFYHSFFCSQKCRTEYVRKWMKKEGIATMEEMVSKKRKTLHEIQA